MGLERSELRSDGDLGPWDTGVIAAYAGRVRVSVPCGYLVRDSGRRTPCRQPVVLLVNGSLLAYAFPPDWDCLPTLSDEELIAKYGRG